ncbi:MAG: hypothetical protein AVDCRST_MAG96-799 [uncultured Segetibacter sp.]|uniref:Uncharacterized protein n=1 Tax=uncultured Segetibacter sp. TaxID=481133 RepID=A0A6J4RWT4_9BACT|nr:MAG: hypothetical protein AVDCRST_MAG96-799 [uncultured Segetibacter sp.]
MEVVWDFYGVILDRWILFGNVLFGLFWEFLFFVGIRLLFLYFN